jgi:hypothetical protein
MASAAIQDLLETVALVDLLAVIRLQLRYGSTARHWCGHAGLAMPVSPSIASEIH